MNCKEIIEIIRNSECIRDYNKINENDPFLSIFKTVQTKDAFYKPDLSSNEESFQDVYNYEFYEKNPNQFFIYSFMRNDEIKWGIQYSPFYIENLIKEQLKKLKQFKREEALNAFDYPHLIRDENTIDCKGDTDATILGNRIQDMCNILKVNPIHILSPHRDEEEYWDAIKLYSKIHIHVPKLKDVIIITDHEPGCIFAQRKQLDFMVSADQSTRMKNICASERYRFCIPSWKSVIRVKLKDD